MRGRRISITPDEHARLERWSEDARETLATRARIVLLASGGRSPQETADELGIGRLTVYKWRRRFLAGGIEALHDRPRPGQPRKLSYADERALVARAVSSIPRDGLGWSIRRLADASSVTEHQVRSAWRRASVDPDRVEKAMIDGTRWFELAAVPLAVLVSPPCEVFLFETRTQLLRTRPQSFVVPTLATLKRRRHRSDGLHAVWDVAAERGDAEDDGLVRGPLAGSSLGLSTHDRRIHVVLGRERSAASLIELPEISNAFIHEYHVARSLDAWLVSVETLLVAIERATDGDDDCPSRHHVRSLRSASERYVRAARAGAPEGDGRFYWCASDERAGEPPMRRSGWFASERRAPRSAER